MDIIGHRKVFYLLSAILISGSVALLVIFGLPLGIDFTGGSLVEVLYQDERPDVETLTAELAPLGFGEVRLQPIGERGFIIRTRHLTEPEHASLLGRIGREATERRFDTVGPTIGEELKQKSSLAIVLVIFLIVGYIAFAFRKVSEPMASWKYGVATIAALAHDVVIPVGVFALAGRFGSFEADTLFITALLTILGFSVHDTIVVFDRIRENLHTPKAAGRFAEVVNASVNQTFGRSVNTSLTVILALSAVYFFGGESTRVLSLALIIGILVGTYSSVFIASPLLVSWHQFEEQRRKRISPK